MLTRKKSAFACENEETEIEEKREKSEVENRKDESGIVGKARTSEACCSGGGAPF